jgi:hypothetical protein
MIRRLLRNISNSGIEPGDPRAADRITMRRIQTLNGYAMFQCAATVFLIPFYWLLGDYLEAVLTMVVSMATFGTALYLRRGGSILATGITQIAIVTAVMMFDITQSGGPRSVGGFVLPLIVVYAGLIIGLRAAGICAVIVSGYLITIQLLFDLGVRFPNRIPEPVQRYNALAFAIFVTLALFTLATAFLRAQKASDRKLIAANAKLAHALAIAERATRAKSEFLANMSTKSAPQSTASRGW